MANFFGSVRNDSISGTVLDDSIFGDVGNDTLLGNAGNDTLDGWDGDDSLSGGSGDDTVYGWFGNDRMAGGNGHDTLFGEDGNDRLDGDAGNDTLYGGDGDDRVNGGPGDDIIVTGDNSGDDDVIVAGTTITTFSLGDAASGGTGFDLFVFDGDDDDHLIITDFTVGADTILVEDSTPADITQIVITSAPPSLGGPGLLILTDNAGGDTDDAIYLPGVFAPLTEFPSGGDTFLA